MADQADRMRVWITGAGGLIGNYLVQTSRRYAPDWDVRGLVRQDLDLFDAAAVQRAFREQCPGLVIHCAALSKTPDCKKDPALARQLNVEVTERLADLAADAAFIFFSSDLVFDGRKGGYVESDPVNPLSVYAETKAAAERIVLRNPAHTVIRASLNGGTSPTGDRGFNEQLHAAFQTGEKLRLFRDEFRCPIPAEVTARAVWEMARQKKPGLYHLAGRERLSRLEMGELIARRWPSLNPKIEPASIREYSGDPRSPDTSLDCTQVQKILSFPLPGLREWLTAHPNEPF